MLSCSIEFPRIYLPPNCVFKRWLGVECGVFTRDDIIAPNDIILELQINLQILDLSIHF